MSLLEAGESRGIAALRMLYKRTGNAHVIGVTGPPGTGKSTIVDKLIAHYRSTGRTVGVVAIDPTSPFTGGAILGDRIRMNQRCLDPGVFIRSLASRGELGGLSRAARDCVSVLDAMGKDIILIETVGVGQAEVDIAKAADSVVVVCVPGLGDDVQNLKAGLMEIADVFDVNKSDMDGADRVASEIQAMLEFSSKRDWTPPIVRTVASKGTGTKELADAIDSHLAHLKTGGRLARARKERMGDELLALVTRQVAMTILGDAGVRRTFDSVVEKVVKREIDPHSACDEIMDHLAKARRP
ncbi:MAG: methylmalonyl Co-A mutase-associated GTPase MeaB [Euryarchaeota archaeon]|nr:methylmalonyl Co-A mutase-associated GTPase MeaB [Euryarchaeota archaeon]